MLYCFVMVFVLVLIVSVSFGFVEDVIQGYIGWQMVFEFDVKIFG